MTDKIVIFVTAANRRQARTIARHLVEAQLAACVNITQPIQSIYRWKERLADDRELLLIIKSARELFPEIKASVSKLHSYATPEIICLPIVDGSPDYLQWIGDSLKQAGSSGHTPHGAALRAGLSGPAKKAPPAKLSRAPARGRR